MDTLVFSDEANSWRSVLLPDNDGEGLSLASTNDSFE